jgi:hypothetical protein
MAEIGMSMGDFIPFIEGKVKFIIDKANSIITRDGLKQGEINNFARGIHSDFWYVTHRVRLNDGMSLDNYLALPEKKQNWSKWLFGLPNNLISSIQYQHKTYPEIDLLGKSFTYTTTGYDFYTRSQQTFGGITAGYGRGSRIQYRWQQSSPPISLATYDNVFYFDLFRGIRVPFSSHPDGYFDILSRDNRYRYSTGDDLFFNGYFDVYTGLTHPDRQGELIFVDFNDHLFTFWMGFKSINYLSSPYLALKHQEEIIANAIRLDEPLPNNIFEELLDLMAPSLFFNGTKFRPVEKMTVGEINLIQENGFHFNKDINKYYSTQILSDDGHYLVEVALGKSGVVFNNDYNSATGFEYIGYNTSFEIAGLNVNGVSQHKNPLTLEDPDYQDYDRYNNIARNLLVTEYSAKETQLDGIIEPLWFGWGPLPPSLGFDLSKISVSGEPPADKVYRPVKEEGRLVWNQDINKLFGEVVPTLDPNVGVSYQNINPGKYVLIPDNY